MAFKAYLHSVPVDPKNGISVDVEVRFEEASTQRSFIQRYKFHPSQVGSIQDMKNIVLADLARINAYAQVIATLRNAVGNEIVP